MGGLTPDRKRCDSLRSDGQPCAAFVGPNGQQCVAHDHEQAEAQAAARVAGGMATRKPTVIDSLRERVEAQVDEIVKPLFDALDATKLQSVAFECVETPDFTSRIAATRELLDRVYGKPRQTTEVTGPDGGAVRVLVEVPLDAERAAAVASILRSTGAAA